MAQKNGNTGIFTYTADQIKDIITTRCKRLEKVIARKKEEGDATKYEQQELAQLVWLLKADINGGSFTYAEARELLGDLR